MVPVGGDSGFSGTRMWKTCYWPSPDSELLARNLADQVVLVTGAGGAGSELCRQILQVRRQPVLVELEFALTFTHC
jgi:hypothetical protein